MSKESAGEGIADVGAALIAIGVLAEAFRVFTASLRRMEIEEELAEWMGEEWLEACKNDKECNEMIDKISRECLEYDLSGDEKEREEYRKRVFEELKQKLKELGVRFYCEEKDLGELGTLYEDCYIEYKEERFSITDLKVHEDA